MPCSLCMCGKSGGTKKKEKSLSLVPLNSFLLFAMFFTQRKAKMCYSESELFLHQNSNVSNSILIGCFWNNVVWVQLHNLQCVNNKKMACYFQKNCIMQLISMYKYRLLWKMVFKDDHSLLFSMAHIKKKKKTHVKSVRLLFVLIVTCRWAAMERKACLKRDYNVFIDKE